MSTYNRDKGNLFAFYAVLLWQFLPVPESKYNETNQLLNMPAKNGLGHLRKGREEDRDMIGINRRASHQCGVAANWRLCEW